MYYVKYEGRYDSGWLGPFMSPQTARAIRDEIRQDGGYAIVHRSTVAIRALVKAWTESQEV